MLGYYKVNLAPTKQDVLFTNLVHICFLATHGNNLERLIYFLWPAMEYNNILETINEI